MKTQRIGYRRGSKALSLLLAGGLAFDMGAVPAQAASESVRSAAAAPHLLQSTTHLANAAVKRVTEVQTTANLNMRSSASTKGKVVATIPKGTKVQAKSQASNGWFQVVYESKTGWVSNKYVKTTRTTSDSVKKTGKTKQKSKKSTSQNVKLWVTPTAQLNIRKGAGTSHKSIGKINKGQPAYATSRAGNGWYKISTKGKTGWISGGYVTTCSRGCEIDAGEYTTNRAGLSDRYFTKSSGANLYASVKGKKRIGDIPKNSVVYRDAKWEKKAGPVSGWIYVRTQGADGWMESSALKRTTNAKTTNASKISRSKVSKQRNGKLPESMLVAIPWDKEKTLIAAPAVSDLTRLNNAFKKKFGSNLDIDLAYRTLDTQKFYYSELGPYIAAKPGTSNHGWGLAIDVPESYDYSFNGKYYKWLKFNSKNYNWVHRKNLEQFRSNGTKNPYAEAWHFEYSGR